MRVILKAIGIFAMFCSINIWAQNSVGLSGFWNLSEKSTALLNSLESNPSNYLVLKDWGLIFSYGGQFSKPISTNLYLISLSKRLGDHAFSVRYTPGYEKEFVFSNGSAIVLEDSSFQQLNSKFTYKELFGFGYSYKFSPKFNLGLSFRYLSQEFNNETFKPVSVGDTLYFLERESLIETGNFWKGDIGINYFINDELSISLASINLFNFGEQSVSEENKAYKIRTDKGALFGATFSPWSQTGLNFSIETNNAFQLGISQIISVSKSNFGFSLTALHDKNQSPFVNGILSGITFSTDLWGVTLSGVKYFNNRNKSHSFSGFKEEAIANLTNNKYSYDKALVSFSFTLNTLLEQSVKFLSVEIDKQIYPTFYEAYIDSPFAFGKVINLTDKSVLLKPSSKIEGMNIGYVQSPTVTIEPRDTLMIPFYAILPDYYNKQKAEISQVYFALTTSGEEPDDNFQLPILVNSVNSWDGRVKNLRYFIKKDVDYSMNFSKNILSQNKSALDTLSYSVSQFYKAKLIFNNFVERIVYTADPRASTEYVQFPNETIRLRGGDCDDLSVCYSSFLESIGIETALVDYKNTDDIRHVNILFNTNLAPENARLITENDSKYFIRKNENGQDEIWIPIETTSLADFNSAWEIGAEKFFNEAIGNYGLVNGKVEIIDVY